MTLSTSHFSHINKTVKLIICSSSEYNGSEADYYEDDGGEENSLKGDAQEMGSPTNVPTLSSQSPSLVYTTSSLEGNFVRNLLESRLIFQFIRFSRYKYYKN